MKHSCILNAIDDMGGLNDDIGKSVFYCTMFSPEINREYVLENFLIVNPFHSLYNMTLRSKDIFPPLKSAFIAVPLKEKQDDLIKGLGNQRFRPIIQRSCIHYGI